MVSYLDFLYPARNFREKCSPFASEGAELRL